MSAYRKVLRGWYEDLGRLKQAKSEGNTHVGIDFAIDVVDKLIIAIEDIERHNEGRKTDG